MSRYGRRVLLALVATMVMVLPAAAQTTGTVAGSVKDAQGGVIPGATVTMTSETRGTKVPGVVTNAQGDFVFVNIAPDSYRVQVAMSGFKTLVRSGVAVSPGERVPVPTLVIEVGGATETVNVTAESALIQAQSGERSFSLGTTDVQNLPIASRSFTELARLAPGVTVDGNQTPTRIGGGGSTNIMMDGVSSNDTGSNRPLLQMNTESIAEVKVLTSGYQAEFGRSSGVQVSAVTKSGSNRFHGSLYDVDRNSKWNSNSRNNILNGNPKTRSKERDFGFSVGGPAGKPGGNNKLFFFYSQEFSPRTGGNNVQRFRLPTALERAGDFSQSTDNNGALFPYVKDPLVTGTCSAANTTACFKDGGVVGRIPQNRLYQTGLNILNGYPLPNITSVPTGQNYNYEITRPAEKILSWQPAVRVDYQATQAFRATWRTSYWKQRSQVFNGNLPGFNDAKMQDKPVTNMSASANYTITQSMFLEATYGHAQNELAGCAQAQSSTGPIFCTAAIPVTSNASLAGANLQDLPFLFPDATLLNPGYYAVKALNEIGSPIWDGTRISKVPTFQWGNRVSNSPPGIGFPGWLNINSTNDFSISLTKLRGSHTFKGGFYNTHSFKAEQTSNNAFGTINFGNDANNPIDSQFGFSNAALGIFSSYNQASKYAETTSIYNNTEFYIQDNWKATGRMTLDYGVRFVHQQAQYDKFGQASNFLFDKWSTAAAPAIYVPGCVGNAATCTGANRSAKNPLTGAILGPSTSVAVGTLVPGTGDPLNGLFLPGQAGLPRATFKAPALGYAPRFGMAYDLTGNQSMVLRGGVGLFFDRPSSSTFSGGVNNPPTSASVTAQYSQLQNLGKGGLATQGVPSINAFQFDSKLPSSVQWNSGIQMALPWAVALDVSYVGQHAYNQYVGTNINTVDFGTAFLPGAIDQTTAGGTTVLPTVLLKPIRGYNNITLQENYGFRTYHSIQVSFNRRFRNGLSFGFNDTISLYDHQQVGRRLQHNADGSFTERADMAQANDLFGDNHPQTHFMRANFVWDLPDLKSEKSALRAIGLVVNDWQLSGIWSGSTAGLYSVGFSYQNGGSNQNLTGSPDYGARVRIVGDTGRGCSGNVYQQFNTNAFAGPLVGSVGLESPNAYLHGCFNSVLDLAIARNIRIGGGRSVQLRLDMFNAPNSATITGRQATMNLNNPADPTTITNPVYDANGAIVRGTPANSGFGLATGYQSPRTMQLQVRFSF
ncbi:MAG: carboxypeptidase regulatory-like domain-containing protein [Acidobacteriota bacterium]